MGLSFLNGAFLGALSLVSIPIIIHLLQRRRYQVVRWGAMEFLRLSQRNRSQRLMIEQIYDLAYLQHGDFNPQSMQQFIDRSVQLLSRMH